MIVTGSILSCGVCFAANTYMAIKAQTSWIKWAATGTAALCVALLSLDVWLTTLLN